MKKFRKFAGDIAYRVVVGVIASLIVGAIMHKAKEWAESLE